MHKISGKTYKKIMFAVSFLACLMLAGEALLIHMKDQSLKDKAQEAMKTNTKEKMIPVTQQSVIRETKKMEPKIRVLLMDSGYDTYQHTKVSVLIQGKAVSYTAKDLKKPGEIITLDGGDEGITVTSIQRNYGNPTYKGALKIKKTENQEALYLINELPLETYLEGVVPSEMPSSYHQEALKAQAVCARTYAWKQIEDGCLEKYGADVDDSVNFQVYQNQAQAEITDEAVACTKGQVMTHNGELIQAYYFSTSAGTTSTDQIWGADSAAPFLKSVACRFDQDQPWGSWKVDIPWEKLEDSTAMYNKGKLQGLLVTKKSESGAVTELTVNTDLGSFLVEGEYDVRSFFTTAGCQITEQDGSTTVGGDLLPSAYFTMEQKAGSVVCIQGKGYGHGVGMSQCGADQMAAEGYTWREILEYFFNDIQITSR